ncbi:hypothetical protein SY83_18495 [Paenibacillus swuensis]|uniref:Helicase XPB/Ssl2 N-terminal domain-containing protein n=1 Tax=Paenibacillus swuensis TaxID=1178515 RepID=A0A172TLM0_9BACL|nr:hypothetical protein [Paenibacillus swuensis]ANE47955.1 hypothetical protein SY83_18495 [Paenibacillus swuensis]
MNLADMLSYADIQDLSRIANYYECDCNGNSKNELIQSILSRVCRKEVFQQHMDNLTTEDLRFLNSLLFDQRNSFSLEELVARVQQTRFSKEERDRWNPRDMITKFKQHGWLFNGFSQQTKYLFQVPHDLKSRFSETLAKQFKSELVLSGEPAAYRDEQELILRDIYQFLHYVHQNDIQLTSDGIMYKKNQQQIIDRFSVHEELVGKGGWRFGYGRRFKEYPNRLSLIYDYCYYQQLIEEQDQRLALTDKGRESVSQDKRENLLHVYKFWLRLYKGPVHNLLSLVHWIDILAKDWVTVQSISTVLLRFIQPYYYDTPESILEQRILLMLLHLGLIRIGEDGATGTVLQVTKLGSSVIAGVYVALDDTIVLPAGSAPELV